MQNDEINVVYDASDFRALYRACRSCRRNAIMLLVLLPLVFGFLSYTDGERGADLLLGIVPFVLIALGTVAGIYFMGPWNLIRQRRKNGWSEPMTVRLTDDGIATRHPSQTSLFYWSKIKDVHVRSHRLFLFTTPRCAIILPRSCFESETQFAEWSKKAKTLWSDHSPKSALE